MMKMTFERTRALFVRGAFAALLIAGSPIAPALGQVAAQETAPSLEILSPAAGAQITTSTVDVALKISNYTVDCAQAGLPDADGVGHVHVMLDGMTMATLTNFYCSDTFSISGDGIAPGKHTLIVDLSTNTHLDMMETAQEVEFDYQPANPVALPAANDLGEPGVELVSPLDGATVPAKFTVEVKAVNFSPSESLEGKQNVPGYGHYHVFVDTSMDMMMMDDMASPEAEEMEMTGTPEEGEHMAMMAMAGMVAMPGTDSFELDLTAWGPGTHTIWIEPVQNDHTVFEAFGHVEFNVTIPE